MLVARAEYFRAEKRGFAPGGKLQDWIEAEAEVLQLIGKAQPGAGARMSAPSGGTVMLAE